MLKNAWLIPLLPAISSVLILAFGKKLPGKGHEIGIGALAISFGMALLCAFQWIAMETHEGHREAVTAHATWFKLAGVDIGAGIHIDGLAVMMLVVVTFISLLVHVYSTGYMHGDRRYTYFFAALSLFTASMLMLVVADNTLQLMIGWELVGLCSFMLIGHWWEEGVNSSAAIKAILTTRFGDVGLMLGIITLFFAAGRTFDIEHLNQAALTGEIGHGVLLAGAALLFLGVMGKSAQFPLHVWLPDAMAGPTPVSALIHAATMVVAGVYLVARLYGVFFEGFSIDAGGINFVALIGGITVLIAAGLAFVQDDVKKVLAYSTVSQLGYMVMALGCGAWTAAVFHLFTHAFFKALLFLGSGSLIHAVHSNNMSEMGGLRKYMPTTYWTFLVGSLALAGIFPLAGFWSKDEILNGAGEGGFPLFVAVGIAGAFMTAAYMTRACYLIFAGEYRGHGHPHESPPSMRWPLVILAVPAAVAGFLNAPVPRQPVPPPGGVRGARRPRDPPRPRLQLAPGLRIAGGGRPRHPRRLPGLRPQRLAQGGDGPHAGPGHRLQGPGQQVLPRRAVRERDRPQDPVPDRQGRLLDQPERHRRGGQRRRDRVPQGGQLRLRQHRPEGRRRPRQRCRCRRRGGRSRPPQHPDRPGPAVRRLSLRRRRPFGRRPRGAHVTPLGGESSECF